MKQQIEVPVIPPIVLPNDDNLQPLPGGTSEVTALVIALLIAVVKTAPFTIREIRLFRRDGEKKPQSSDEE